MSCSLTLQQTPALKAVQINSMKILLAMFAHHVILLALLAVGLPKQIAYLALPITTNLHQELVFQLVIQPSIPLEEAHQNA